MGIKARQRSANLTAGQLSVAPDAQPLAGPPLPRLSQRDALRRATRAQRPRAGERKNVGPPEVRVRPGSISAYTACNIKHISETSATQHEPAIQPRRLRLPDGLRNHMFGFMKFVLRNLEHGRANVLPFTRARPLRAGGATQRVALGEPRKRRASQRPRVGCYGELGRG